MRKKIFLISILVFSFNLLNTLAQMPSEPKKISGGVLNAKAIKLVKPSYPAAALAVRASGAVIVQVLVDEQGNVISASAVSGHPLLRQACEQAAFAAKFNPTILEGQPVRVSGVIVYNFVATMSFIQIGYELTLAENSASLKEAFPANDIVGSLPKDWTEEKAVVWKIGSNFVEKSSEEKIPQTEEKKITQASSQTNKSAPPREGIATRIGSGNTIGYGDAIGSGIATSISTDKISTEFDNLNKAETIQKLRAKIENRLSSDEKKLWYFKLGSLLGKISSQINEDNTAQLNFNNFNQLVKNIPSDIPEPIKLKVREINVISRKINMSLTEQEKIVLLIKDLRNLQIP